ncbi:MAG: Spy/CpxP family protein refolding chaperone [Dokdonella sp.]
MHPSSHILPSLLRRFAPLALVASLVCGGAVLAFAHGPAGADFHHGPISRADAQAHVEQMLANVEVTPAQKAQIDTLLQPLLNDFGALHEQMNDTHAQLLHLLAADPLDRNAIEALRVAHVQAMDKTTQRIAQSAGDIAQVLTPVQRKTLVANITRHQAAMQD